jgi:DNA-binding LytR/AlgR family response regulator
MNIIIIEDERRTATELQKMLEGIDGEIRVTAMLTSVATAIKWLQENPAPDLIFADIQLGDGLSFEIFKEIEVDVPVIFCTAFDKYAIDAFEANSIDYLLKPLEEDLVERSLKKYDRFKKLFSGNAYADNLKNLVVQMGSPYKQSILVHYREKIIPVKVEELNFIYAANGTVVLHTLNNNVYTVNYTVEQLEAMLNPQHFFKANRQFIINRNIIENIEHYFNRRLIVKTKCEVPEKIVVSRLKAQDFLNWMEK